MYNMHDSTNTLLYSLPFQVHDLMDDIAEQQDLANEISAAISSPMGFGNDVDEDDLLAELEGMEQEEMDRQVCFREIL